MAAFVGYVVGDSNHTIASPHYAEKWSHADNQSGVVVASNAQTAGVGSAFGETELYAPEATFNYTSDRVGGATFKNIVDVIAPARPEGVNMICIAGYSNDISRSPTTQGDDSRVGLFMQRSMKWQIQYAKAAGYAVLALQIPPRTNSGGLGYSTASKATMKEFNDWLALYGPGLGAIVVNLWEPLLVAPGLPTTDIGDQTYFSDHVHYNTVGHAFVGGIVDAALAPFV